MNNQEIKIFQIYYDPAQKTLLDPQFTPFYNAGGGVWHEYGVFKNQYESGKIQTLTGYLSWKFNFKTNLTGKTVINFIKANPGYDVYFFNPFFELETLYKNVWEQGEVHHKGIIKMAESIYSSAGYDFRISEEVHDVSKLLYCNYWVGTPQFWEKYMSFLNKVEIVMSNSTKEIASALNQKSGYHSNANYIPFILERSFSTFIYNMKEVKACAYKYSDYEKTEIIIKLRSSSEREFELQKNHSSQVKQNIIKRAIGRFSLKK